MPQTDKLAELDAVQTVLALLAQFDDAPRNRILRTVLEFYKSENLDNRPITLPSPARQFFERRPPSISEYLDTKKPRSSAERVLCLADYLDHFRSTETFRLADLQKLAIEARLPKSFHASSALKQTIRDQLISPVASGVYRVSDLGHNYVEVLPDRDQAQQSLFSQTRTKANSRITRRRK